MKNKVFWHEVVLFGVISVLIIWKLIFRHAVFDVYLLWWILGLIIGFIFIFLDRFVYSLTTHTSEPLSLKIRELFKQNKFFEGVSLLINERKEQRELVMRSVLFFGVWVVLALFTMTSSTSAFARGFMLGIGTHLIFDMTSDYVTDKQRFDLWFWQIKRQVGMDEKKWFFGIVILLYIMFAFGL